MAGLVQSYVENYRGRPDHAFLLNSQKQRPLSTESLTKLFAKASDALPSVIRDELSARTGRSTVTPHDLRYLVYSKVFPYSLDRAKDLVRAAVSSWPGRHNYVHEVP